MTDQDALAKIADAEKVAQETGLVRRESLLGDAELDRLVVLAKNMAASGLFPDARRAPEAFAKLVLGRDLGLNASQSLTGIHVVEGKPMLAATTLAGFVRQHPSYDYEVAEHDEKRCAIRFLRRGIYIEGAATPFNEMGVSAFTIEEARAAGLVKPKSGWEKYPRNMLFARALSNGVRWFCPDLFGGIPVYSEADEFTPRGQLSAGEGSGEAEGIDLPPEVEAVIERASELGHAALSNRAAIEVTLAGQPEPFIEGWVESASADLDRMEVPEADVVPEAGGEA